MSDFVIGKKGMLEISGIHGWVLFERHGRDADWEECGIASNRKDAQFMRAIFEKINPMETEYRLLPRAQVEALRILADIVDIGKEEREAAARREVAKWEAYNDRIRKINAERRARKEARKNNPPKRAPGFIRRLLTLRGLA